MKVFSAGMTLLVVCALAARAGAADDWLKTLNEGLKKEYSQTRHDALKQVDIKTAKGLKVLWKVLDGKRGKDPLVVDWFVREGAYEALSNVETAEAKSEILRLLESKGNPLSKEAVVYSVIWKIRRDFVKDARDDPELGENPDRREENAKLFLRRKKGLEYFELMLPRLARFDPDGERFKWIQTAFKDSDSRVRLAALHGFLFYPHDSTVPLLIDNMARMKKLEAKSKRNRRLHYREWVVNRFVLEQLSGEYYRDVVEDWQQWWSIKNSEFSLEKRVEEEIDREEEGEGEGGGRTVIARTVPVGGVEVKVNMKIAGRKEGYPLLVVPWRDYEPDYFRPYFHGIEEFLKVYYLYVPRIGDFRGLARGEKHNIVMYPTKLLAEALATAMKDTGLERFAVLGHGQGASTLAMHLAAAHPKQVSHLIMISPRSAGDRYGDALRNVQREGRRRQNRELVKGVDHVFVDEEGKPNYEPADSAEAGGLSRAMHNVRFADPTAPEVGAMGFLFRLPGGTNVMNDNTWSMRKLFKGKKPRLPVMVVVGERNPWTPLGDVQGVAKFFGAYVARFPKSSEMPFLFEPYDFTRQMELFFKKYSPKKKSSKKGKRSRTRGK